MKLLILAAGLCLFMPAMAADLPAGPVRGFTAQIIDARARAKVVWPGFDLFRDPILIHYPETGTVLLDDAAPPAGFVRMRPGVSYKPGRFALTAARFETKLPFRGRSAFFFRYDSNEGYRAETVLLVHEVFHKHQAESRALEIRPLPADEAGKAAYAAHIENAALFQALASPDRFLDEARTFVALRRKRLAIMDRFQADALLAQETREGSAEYVALRSSLEGLLDPGPAATILTPPLADALFAFTRFDADAAGRLQVSVYGSGPAQMLILDRLRAPWKDRVARGEAIFAVMLDAVSSDGEAGRIKRALARWGDPGLELALRTPRTAVANEPDELWATFARSPQPRLLLRIWDAAATPGLYFSGERMPVSGPARATLYANMAEASMHTLPGVSATFRRTSVRSGSGKDQRRVGRMDQFPVEIEALLPAPALWRLRADGKDFTLGATKRVFRTLEWTSPNIDLVILRPGSITHGEGRVLVEVDPP